uniref:Carboxypeptidase regulatory-like domain-containing protein n=1 Tax=Panagrolaimus davidi TaxID=227884 RepID=A0A914PS24_9BILA
MVHRGVKGIVSDANGNPLGNATIRIAEGSITGGKNITTTSLGEYWRILSPGNYKVCFFDCFWAFGNFIWTEFFIFSKFPKVRNIKMGYKKEIEVIHADHEPYKFEIDIDNGPVKIFNISMKDIPCNLEDNQQILIRGKGNVKLALLALDSDAGDLLKQVANSTCPSSDPQINTLLKHGRLGFFPAYNQMNDLSVLKSFSPDAIILLSTGSAHSVVYNKGEFTPKLFNANAFDESVKRAFNLSIGTNSSCKSKLDEPNTSLMVDNMEISNRFQLGIAIGCQPKNDSKRAEAAITGIIEVLSIVF